MKSFCLIILLPIAFLLTGCKSTSKLEVVTGFEVDRYLGVWYEAARYPHRFETGLSNVSAEYSRNADGTIKVVNRGFSEKKSQWETAEAVAKPKGAPSSGWLKVSFFKPFYASYKIIYLNEDYTQAIVTGPTYGYLWILARDPALPQRELDLLVERIQGVGFDSGKLIYVDQTKNRQL
jgi:apolipoprotein D and lipocalin family protein